MVSRRGSEACTKATGRETGAQAGWSRPIAQHRILGVTVKTDRARTRRDAVRLEVIAVSDASASTAGDLAETAVSLFPVGRIGVVRVPGVNTVEQARAVVGRAKQAGAVIAHVLVLPDVRAALLEAASAEGVPAVDLLGQLYTVIEQRVPAGSSEPARTDGDQPNLRVEAINFTVRHDDGQRPDDLPTADLVLVGPSRTSKTPLSVYLSFYGLRVANVPLLLHVSPPEPLFAVPRERVVGLAANLSDLLARRKARSARLGVPLPEYTDPRTIQQELALLLDLCRRCDWRVVSVSKGTIEETAEAILDLVGAPLPRTR